MLRCEAVYRISTFRTILLCRYADYDLPVVNQEINIKLTYHNLCQRFVIVMKLVNYFFRN